METLLGSSNNDLCDVFMGHPDEPHIRSDKHHRPPPQPTHHHLHHLHQPREGRRKVPVAVRLQVSISLSLSLSLFLSFFLSVCLYLSLYVSLFTLFLSFFSLSSSFSVSFFPSPCLYSRPLRLSSFYLSLLLFYCTLTLYSSLRLCIIAFSSL